MARVSDNAKHGEVVYFGEFQFYADRRMLTKSQTPLHLGDRAFDLLAVLLEKAPNVVSQEELLQTAWSGLTVASVNVRYQINQLRKALGDVEKGSCFVATVQGRGYCFLAPIRHSRVPQPMQNGGMMQPAGDLKNLQQA
jgi:DNA-binding winged helix-turn-helix (wHTH) protein